MALTGTFVKNVKHKGGAIGENYADGGNLYLHVNASGKYLRMAYRFAGKHKTLAIDVYPAVSMAKARQRRDKAREMLADGVDPSVAKREEKQSAVTAAANTFELVALDFLGTTRDSWSPKYAAK